MLYDSPRVEEKSDSEDRAPRAVDEPQDSIPHSSNHRSKQDLVRLPAKPSTAPAESASYRLRQHPSVASASNQREEEDHDVQRHLHAHVHSDSEHTGPASAAQQPLAAFFAGKSVHRARRLSISAAHAAHMQAMAANSSGGGAVAASGSNGAGALTRPVTVAKRRLLVDSSAPQGPQTYRAPQSVMLTSPRGRNNASDSLFALGVASSLLLTSLHLARICVCLRDSLMRKQLSSKLDSVIKSSQWMRRKVVMGEESSGKQMPGRSTKLQQYSPRHGSIVNSGASHGSDTTSAPSANAAGTAATGAAAGVSSSGDSSRDISHHDLEKKVMAAFSRSARCSRAPVQHSLRRCRSLSSTHSLYQCACVAPCAVVRMWRERKRRSEAKTLTMMNGNKLRKDNGIQSAHVVGILSRRMIREVPALKFFDVEPETPLHGSGSARGEHSTAASTAAANRNTPRGVCYTLDANGCRCIKMESGALRASRMNQRDHRHRKSEEITIEKAMGKTLRRKCVVTLRYYMIAMCVSVY